jgi:hypothetical protein
MDRQGGGLRGSQVSELPSPPITTLPATTLPLCVFARTAPADTANATGTKAVLASKLRHDILFSPSKQTLF